MEFIRTLTDIQQQELNIAGGKGANLGVLTRAGFPVPPGFVLLTNAYQHFLHINGLLSELEQLARQAKSDDLASCEKASQSIRTLFTHYPIPDAIIQVITQAYQQLAADAVAVRSSATTEDLPTASFAGLHESYLNIKTLDDIFTAVRQCWSSLWTPRALSYRTRLGLDAQKINMAVVIQQMVPASASGVLFTVNPVNGSHEEITINATKGVGEGLVAGQITPETMIAEKTSGHIIQREHGSSDGVGTVGQEPFVLTDKQVIQLVRLGKRIEEHFTAPQDIEWALAGEQIFIVQARPITTLTTISSTPKNHGLPIPPGNDTWNREQDQPPRPYDVWTRTNVGENLPYPITPLTETHLSALFALNTAPSEPDQPQLMRRLYGRLYFNEGAIVRSFTEEMGLPAAWLHKIWGSRPRGSQANQNAFRPWRLLRKLFSLVINQSKTKKKARIAHDSPRQFFAQVDQWVNAFLSLDLSQLDDAQLWNAGLPIWSERGTYTWETNIRFSIGAAVSYGLLERIVHWWIHKDLVQDLVTSLPGVYSAEVGPALWKMAQLAQEEGIQEILLLPDPHTALERLRSDEQGRLLIEQLEIFLARHGHRCPNELEMRNPRWSEAPEQVIELIASYLRAGEHVNPDTTEARQQQRRTEAVNIIATKLDPIRRFIFLLLLKRTQQAVTVRDNSRYTMAKFIFPMRKIYAEIGRRWTEYSWLKQADDIFFLTIAEIESIIKDHAPGGLPVAMQTCIEQRRLAYEFWLTISAPEAVAADGSPIFEEEDNFTLLKGTAASSGTIRGRARIVQTLQEAMSLKSGDILVTSATDPGWTPVFPLVSGIVLEIGGQLSHGAIIAREYGIPAVVNAPRAMHLIQDGQIIEIDGSKGVIRLT